MVLRMLCMLLSENSWNISSQCFICFSASVLHLLHLLHCFIYFSASSASVLHLLQCFICFICFSASALKQMKRWSSLDCLVLITVLNKWSMKQSFCLLLFFLMMPQMSLHGKVHYSTRLLVGCFTRLLVF